MKRSKEHRLSCNLYTHKHTEVHILTHYKQGPSIKLPCVSKSENKAHGTERAVATVEQ